MFFTIGAANRDIKTKEMFAQKPFHIDLRLLMFYQIFFSERVKQCGISTYKYGVYELPHELPNELRLRI